MKRILLVQKNAKELQSIQRLFVSNHFDFITTYTTKGAIRLLESDPSIDLVICGLKLVDKSGVILLQYIKQTPRFHYIPIIMTCGSNEREDVEEALKYYPDDIIVKPVTKEVITEKVNKAISRGKRTILLVDDEEIILDLLKHVITLERFNVITATNGKEALSLMEKNVVHAVVTDVLMPDLNGMDLLKAVKEKYNHIPVIIITGHAGEFTPEKSMSAGADGYFKKPFRNTELIKVLKRVIQNSHRKELAHKKRISKTST